MSRLPRLRRRSGRRLIVLPILAVLLAVGAKLVTMYVFAATGADAYDDQRYGHSETSYGRLDTINLIEPWRAEMGVGDARYRRGDLLGATAAFARALQLAPGHCDIRFNLAVTIEAVGDRLYAGTPLVAADADLELSEQLDGPEDTAERYSVALGIVEAGECPSLRADDHGDRLATTHGRLIAKLAALDDDRPDDDEAASPEAATESERGDSEQIDDLELRNESGASQREAARDRDTSGATPDGRSNW